MALPTVQVASPVPKGGKDYAVDSQTGKAVKSALPVNIPKDTDVAWDKSTVVQAAKPGVIPKSGGVSATLTYVEDGDTAKFNTKNGPALNCRIEGIDAPETDKSKHGGKKGQPYAEESKQTLKDLLAKGEIQVTVTQAASEKNYGRSICKIEVSGKNVSRSMLEAGAAMLYEQYNKSPEDAAAQMRAATAGKGLWGQDKPPIAPWSYRHTK